MTILLLMTGIVYGQTTATLEGTVLDQTGAVLPGVKVTVVQTATSLSRSVTSDANGYYRISNLPIGSYTLTAEQQGFTRTILRGIRLQVDQVARLDVSMKVGALAEEVTVEAQAPLTDTATATIGGVIENRQIVDLPLNGRYFMQLALLVPGTISSPEGTTQASWGTVGGRIGFSVSGNRDSYNVFTLDGVNVMDRHYNTITVSPSVDAIQEFKIVANAYSAEYGLLPGAQVDIVTKSGTNQFNGSLYEFIRNDALDAKNFFDDPNNDIPPFRQNQFGGSIGGPIIQNRTFFFGNYEGLRIRQSLTNLTLLPTAAMRRGDLSGINPATGSPFPQIQDPQTGMPFPNNQVPMNRFHPLAAGILALTPSPNIPNAAPGQFNHVAIGKRNITNDQFTIRVDHQFNDRNLFFARYAHVRNDETEPFVIRFSPGIAPPEGFGDIRNEQGRNIAIGLTTTISSTFINSFRFGFNRLNARRISENADRDFLGSVGLERTGGSLNGGVPVINIPGFGLLGDSDNLQPNLRRNNTYQFRDDVSYTHGNLTHQWGAEYRRLQTQGVADTFSQGEFRFGDERLGFGQVATGTGFSDFLLNRPRLSLVQLGLGLGNYRSNYFGIYYSGTWRATPRLSLNYGLRYEFETQPAPIRGEFTSVLDPTRGVIIIGSQEGVLPPLNDPLTQYFIDTFGIQFATNRDLGLPASINPTDFQNWGPRLGFAWDVLGNTKMVVRGAFGIFNNLHERHYETNSSKLGPPFAPTIVSFQNSLFVPSLPPLTYENVFLQGGPADRPSTDGGPSTAGVPPGVVDGYVQQWTVSVQSQLTNNVMAEAAYVGSRGINANGFIVGNQNLPNTRERRGGLPPDPRYGESFQEHSGGDSWYHGVSLRLQQRFRQGLTYIIGYTFSKSLDTVSTFTGGPTDSPVPQDSYDLAANKAPSNFDMRHRFVLSYLYELPFGKGKRFLNQGGIASVIFGNWQLGGVLTLQSGQPFSPRLSSQVSGLVASGADRPNRLADGNLPSSQRDPNRWFDVSAFTLPDLITPSTGRPYRILGNSGRNILEGPGFKNLDMSLAKAFPFNERHQLEFRADFFNFTNHPNFNIPDRFFGSATFGKVNSAKFPRQIQFGLRYSF